MKHENEVNCHCCSSHDISAKSIPTPVTANEYARTPITFVWLRFNFDNIVTVFLCKLQQQQRKIIKNHFWPHAKHNWFINAHTTHNVFRSMRAFRVLHRFEEYFSVIHDKNYSFVVAIKTMTKLYSSVIHEIILSNRRHQRRCHQKWKRKRKNDSKI